MTYRELNKIIDSMTERQKDMPICVTSPDDDPIVYEIFQVNYNGTQETHPEIIDELPVDGYYLVV